MYSKEGQKFVVKAGSMPIRNDFTQEDLSSLADPIAVKIVADFANTDYNFDDEIVTFWGNELYAELRQKVQDAIVGKISSDKIVSDFDAMAAKIRLKGK